MTVTMNRSLTRLRHLMAGDDRAWLGGLLRFPGLEREWSPSLAEIEAVMRDCYATRYFPSGPMKYVSGHGEVHAHADLVGYSLAYVEEGEELLSGRLFFGGSGDTVAAGAFARGPARPDSPAEALLADAEAALIDFIILAHIVAFRLPYVGHCQVGVTVFSGHDKEPVHLLHYAEDDWGLSEPRVCDDFGIVSIGLQVPGDPTDVHKVAWGGALELARRFGAPEPQLLGDPALGIPEPEEMRPVLPPRPSTTAGT